MASSEIRSMYPRAAGETARPLQRDRDVVLVRRLDWRFLLPSPMLERVLYVGPAQTDLADALRQFAAELTIVEPPFSSSRAGTLGSAFDLLVGQGGLQAVGRALPHLSDGGSIYWEVRRPAGGSPFVHPDRWAGRLRALGLDEVRIHWHRPNFSSCLEIVPLADDRALRFAFDKVHDSLKGRLKLLFGKTLLMSGALPRLISCFSLVARKRPVG